MSKTVIYTEFSRWRGSDIIVGVRVTAGSQQFTFYLGNDKKVVEDPENAKGWKSHQRQDATKLNAEMVKVLKQELANPLRSIEMEPKKAPDDDHDEDYGPR